MAEFFRSIIIASVICCVFALLTPSGETKSGKYIRLTASLTVLTVLFSPLVKIKSAVTGTAPTRSEAFAYDEYTATGSVTRASVGVLAGRIREICHDRYGVDENSVTVKVITDEDGETVNVTEIQVFITDADKSLCNRLGIYLGTLFDCDIYVLGG